MEGDRDGIIVGLLFQWPKCLREYFKALGLKLGVVVPSGFMSLLHSSTLDQPEVGP